MRKLTFSLLFSCLIIQFSFAIGDENTDSLIGTLKKKSGKEKVDLLNQLSMTFISYSTDSALYYALQAMDYSNKIMSIAGKGYALKSIGNVYYYKGQTDSALKYYNASLKVAEKIKDRELSASDLNNIGNIFETSGDYEKSLNYYLQVLKIDSEMNNVNGVGSTLTNIGNIYLDIGSYSAAAEYYRKSIDIAMNTEDFTRLISAYNNLGLAYQLQEDYENATQYYLMALKKGEETNDQNSISQTLLNLGNINLDWKDYNKALEFYTEAKEVIIESDNKIQLADVINNIGIIYDESGKYDEAIAQFKEGIEIASKANIKNTLASLFLNIGISYEKTLRFDDALLNFQKSIALREELEKKDDLALAMHCIGRIFYMKGNYSEALKYLKECDRISPNLDTKISNYEILSAVYEKIGNLEVALNYYKKLAVNKDSLFTQQKFKQINELQTRYETEKKQQKINSLQRENELQTLKIRQNRLIFFLILSGSVIIIFIGIILLRNNQLRSKHRILTVEQKLLRSQMNPHFIFNSLSAIQSYIIKNNPLDAASYLSKFAKLMRSILENSRMEFISLDSEIETLENYLLLQKARLEEKLSYFIHIDEELDTENLAIPPMLSQPFIENAIEHGILKKEGKEGILEIRFKKQDDSLIMEIEDNGTGRAHASKNQKPEHQARATEITTHRFALLSKAYKKKLRFEIIDLYNKNNEPAGTKIVFALPLRYL